MLWPIPPDGDAESWELRRQTWADPRAILGGSDAGAHLDRMCGAPCPTRVLGDCLRGRKLVSVERAVPRVTGDQIPDPGAATVTASSPPWSTICPATRRASPPSPSGSARCW